MLRKNITKTSLFLVFTLVIFSVPMTSFAGDECPCFTAKDVMRFTPPSPFTCLYTTKDSNIYYDLRITQRDKYFAYFDAVEEVLLGTDNFYCEAYASVGDSDAPTVVLLGNEDGSRIHIECSVDEYNACLDLLLNTHAKRIGDCDLGDLD